MDQADIDAINNRLKDVYGLYYDGKPNFRIVWSDSQVEKRFGHYEIFKGPIFIRALDGIMEVPKYSWIKERWVLERREGHAPNPELPNTIEYEPKWVFENEIGPVDPAWWAVERIIHAIMNPRPKRTQKDIDREEAANIEREKRETMDALDSATPELASQLYHGQAVVKPVDTKNGEVVNSNGTTA